MFDVNFGNESMENWHESDGVLSRGHAFYEGKMYEGGELSSLIRSIASNRESLICGLEKLNGSFCVIYQDPVDGFVATDKLSSIPLFFSKRSDAISIYLKVREFDGDIIDYQVKNLIYVGYTLGEETVCKGLYRLGAGRVMFSDGEVIRYHAYLRKRFPVHKQLVLDRMSAASDAMFEQLAQRLGGKQAVIPLSGGYDSRFILSGLVKSGYDNIFCYTYGNSKSFEIDIAKRVSKKLGVKHKIIEYDEVLWQEIIREGILDEYLRFSFNFSSVPHVQDLPAVYYLSKHEIIDQDGVFVPGYCGDLLGGSYQPSIDDLCKIRDNRISLADYIIDRQFTNSITIPGSWRKTDIEIIEREIRSKQGVLDIETIVSDNESWFTDNKVSKFILNSLRVYEMFGFEWVLPLWSDEFVEASLEIPWERRSDNALYNEFMFDNYFIPLRVDIRKQIHVNNRGARRNTKDTLKRVVPKPVFKAIKDLKDIIYPYDVNNLKILGEFLESKLGLEKVAAKNINAVIAMYLASSMRDRG